VDLRPAAKEAQVIKFEIIKSKTKTKTIAKQGGMQ